MDSDEYELKSRQAIESLLTLNRNNTQFTVEHADKKRLVMLHGLVAHTLNMSEGGLVLIDQNRSDAAKPLARVALEHAVYAQWAYLHEQGIEGLQAKANSTFRKIYNGRPKEYVLPENVQRYYEAMPLSSFASKEVDIFEQMCDSLEGAAYVYPTYRILSGSVHPGDMTFREYILGNPESESFELSMSSGNRTDRAVLNTFLWAIVLAMGVYENLRKGRPNAEYVDKIAREFGISSLLKLKPPN